MVCKVGTSINLKKTSKHQRFQDDLVNSLFWASLVLAILYCLYA